VHIPDGNDTGDGLELILLREDRGAEQEEDRKED